MNRLIRIGLKRNILREHLSRENRCAATDEHINAWLEAAGFRHRGGDLWLVKECDLGHLEPCEVASIEEVDADEAQTHAMFDIPPGSTLSPHLRQ